ncbi:MAG: 23S rRNA (guanosine(2251)-2'-O)-methyltransferase RlmB [Thermoleophilaceae bacterium]
MIVYGRNPVREALRGRRRVARVWATERVAREPWLRDAREVVHATDAELAQRSGSPDHQGICADASEFEYADPRSLLAADDALVICLDEVTDPRNLGAICRVAEGAGAAGVVVGERRSAHVTPVVCKSSAGAVEHLPVARVRNVADFLAAAKEDTAWVYGASTSPEAVPYDQPDYRGRVVLVLGSEGRGLRPRVAAACDQLIALPMLGRVESLNVSAAAAALVYGILHFVRPGLTGFHKPGNLARTDKA